MNLGRPARAALHRVAVVTVSDRRAAGAAVDRSGPAVAELLLPLSQPPLEQRLVADDAPAIVGLLRELAGAGFDLIVTTGGTGLAPRDVTPQATLGVVDYQVPGLPEVMRARGLLSTPMSMLSRGVAGVLGRCLIINLPGSPAGARESLEAIMEALPHALSLLQGGDPHAAGRPGPD